MLARDRVHCGSLVATVWKVTISRHAGGRLALTLKTMARNICVNADIVVCGCELEGTGK